MEFAEYSANFSKDAKESRKTLPAELLPTLDDIQNELLENPNKYPNRVVPVSRDGKIFVYIHPDPAIQITYEIDHEKKIIYFFLFSAPSLKIQKTLFISYSHKDEEWLNKLREFLSVLEQQGVVKFWDDTQLEVGKPWYEQVLKALESAHAGVLLVSQKFLQSEFINKSELPKLLEGAKKKGKNIFWIHLSPSTVFESHKEITEFQSLQKDPTTTLEELSDTEQKKVFVQISKKLSEAVTRH